MKTSLKTYVWCGIATIILLVIGINIGYDQYRKNELKRIKQAASQAAQEADEMMTEYQKNVRERERILTLEKIHLLRGLTSLERQEARELIESQIAYCKKTNDQTARDYERALTRIRREWRVE